MRPERCFGAFRPKKLALPHSRPMPVIGSRCHELRIQDQDVTWFAKRTSATPRHVIDVCKQRLAKYEKAAKEQDE